MFRPKSYCACAVSRDSGMGVKSNHIFGIPDPELPIHFTTFRGLWWWLRVLHWLASEPPQIKRCGRKFSVRKRVVFGPPTKTPGRMCLKLTDNSFPVRPYTFCHIWRKRRLAVLTRWKNRLRNITTCQLAAVMIHVIVSEFKKSHMKPTNTTLVTW